MYVGLELVGFVFTEFVNVGLEPVGFVESEILVNRELDVADLVFVKTELAVFVVTELLDAGKELGCREFVEFVSAKLVDVVITLDGLILAE